jgi:hypothetical protein
MVDCLVIDGNNVWSERIVVLSYQAEEIARFKCFWCCVHATMFLLPEVPMAGKLFKKRGAGL